MNRTHRGTGLLAGDLLPLLGIPAEPLNVKLGLWEITSETRMSGTPQLPQELLDNMTPEQRSAVEAAIAAQADKGPLRDTSRQCITKADIEEPFRAQDIEGCTQTRVANSSTSQEMQLVCTGARSGEGTFSIMTPTPESMTGRFELKVGDGSDAMTIVANMQGKWIAGACEDEAEAKPKGNRSTP